MIFFKNFLIVNLLASALIVGGYAQAQRVNLIGQGNKSCGDYAAVRSKTSLESNPLLAWVLGSVSAQVQLATWSDYNFSKIANPEERLHEFIMSTCNNRPNRLLWEVAKDYAFGIVGKEPILGDICFIRSLTQSGIYLLLNIGAQSFSINDKHWSFAGGIYVNGDQAIASTLVLKEGDRFYANLAVHESCVMEVVRRESGLVLYAKATSTYGGGVSSAEKFILPKDPPKKKYPWAF
jgi:hypothetical protein